MDVLTPEQRRKNMQNIRGKNSRPEMLVRSLLHRAGYRYRLHATHLPGKPDLVFASRRKIVFVHGCFWHLHSCRFGSVVPRTRADFWREKREENRRRDRRAAQRLRAAGWTIHVVWECELRHPERIVTRLKRFLA